MRKGILAVTRTGCTTHLSPHLDWMENEMPYESEINLAEEGKVTHATAKGDIKVSTCTENGIENVHIKGVLHVPNLRDGAKIYNEQDDLIAEAQIQDRITSELNEETIPTLDEPNEERIVRSGRKKGDTQKVLEEKHRAKLREEEMKLLEQGVRRSQRIKERNNVNFILEPEERIPENYEEAINCENKYEWLEAMKEELYSIDKHKVWTLVQREKNMKIINCKWIFSIKSTPVIRKESLRAIVALAAQLNLVITSYDVKTAYLYGELKETIFMKQPEGFVEKGLISQVTSLLSQTNLVEFLGLLTADIRRQDSLIKTRQHGKLSHWICKYDFPEEFHPDRRPAPTLLNLSSTVLSPLQTEVLSLGLKYRPPTIADIPKIISGVEPAISSLSHTSQYDIRSSIAQILRKPTPPQSQSLGSQTVVLDTVDYTSKMTEILSDHTTFIPIAQASPMGSPLSSPLAEIVMATIDHWIQQQITPGIHMWRRYIDDIFCICDTGQEISILDCLNSYHPEISFSLELEDRKKKKNAENAEKPLVTLAQLEMENEEVKQNFEQKIQNPYPTSRFYLLHSLMEFINLRSEQIKALIAEPAAAQVVLHGEKSAAHTVVISDDPQADPRAMLKAVRAAHTLPQGVWASLRTKGKLVLHSSNPDTIPAVTTSLANKLDGMKVRQQKVILPRICLFKVDEETSNSTIEETLLETPAVSQLPGDKVVRVAHRSAPRNGTCTAFIEVDLTTFRALGNRGRIVVDGVILNFEESIRARVCFRCCGFGHNSAQCTRAPTCFHCGEDGHEGRACPSVADWHTSKCANCCAKGLPDKHEARASSCPILKLRALKF
ncbi:hypothetical protein LAZ67_10000926 [Cordylochernes scorpioides]|uniref:CCHC-type domain-containing protein n=1 Tax=Cordylochernes scorpioides TaxID=51811 RepID=A0ABY6KVE4_9ARAC|nr:hypothetical protein LAZ67_10000926 [Cordylochernes scorpioides]